MGGLRFRHRLHEQWRSSVGAGLPAMQAPRFVRQTRVMPSQASQHPHLNAFQIRCKKKRQPEGWRFLCRR
ncbi:hypothetical protein F7R12_13115 [Pseudomonas tolaasii]|nr:hypothetical protein B5P22_15545 [Pseudomonas tolaasii]KAB0475487.1 hypothetical protein F7R12_13115 [Pseudomonas tolaasii]